jgi:acetylornithine aminotransferase/acetylornithine/N-succinyldiaminopimelate aminotransferase
MANQAEILSATAEYIVPNYGPRLRAMVRGQGARIWDADGREYVDFFAGFGGAGIVGHCHPAIVEAVTKQLGLLHCHGNFFTNEPQVDLAQRIVKHSFPGKVFYCHSGAEANEAALKLVRLAARGGQAKADGPYKIISFHHCFHGRTMGGLSLTPQRFQAGFEPMLPGNVMVPYNDLAAVRAAVDDQTAGIFVEPIQCEGGMNMPTREYMQGLRALCDEKHLLLVCDEVWTGPARTGKWFAYQHYGIVPDVMTVAKAIGGGLPVGVCVAASKWADVLGPGKHGCTMGGMPVCTAAGAAAMKLIEDEDLVQQAVVKGQQIRQLLTDAKVPCIKEIRGAGLLIGIEIDKPAGEIFKATLDAGMFICYSGTGVLRLAPPLVIDDATLRKGVEILVRVLKS